MSNVTDGLTKIGPGEKSERKAILALTIEQASESLKRLLASGLNKRAIVLLVSSDSGVGKGDVERVLDSLGNLHKTYCA